MIKYIFCFLSLFLFFEAIAQPPLPEAELKKYLSAGTETDKNKVIFRYLYINRNDSLIITEAAKLTEYFNKNNNEPAIDYIQLAVGVFLSHTGDYNTVLNDAIQILERSEKRKDNYCKMLANKVISLAYYAAGDNEKTIYYDKQTIILSNIYGDLYDLAMANNNISADYVEYGFADSGLNYAKEAVRYAQKTKDQGLLSTTLGTYGENLFAQKKYDSAIFYFRTVLQFGKSNDVLNYVWTLNDLAQVFIEINKPDSAVLYANEAAIVATEQGFKPQLLRSYNYIFNSYDNRGLVDSSLKYLKLIIQTKDILFNSEKSKQFQAISLNEQVRHQAEMQGKIAFRNKVKLYSLLIIVIVFLVTGILLAKNNRQKQKANLIISEQKSKVENALSELKATQKQLFHSEKMASLGELIAGIAHEIQNPLNFVNNFSEVSNELIEEFKSEKSKPQSERDEQLENEILNDISQNLEKINHHGKRADAIVKGMLQHSRTSNNKKEPTNINALCDEYLRLAYHGLRAKDKSFNATLKTEFDASIGNINIISQDIGRVILNLITNAFYAVDEKKKSGIEYYEPTITVRTQNSLSSGEGRGEIMISVHDNGAGIPQSIIDKIFQPFFTTKPTGQGTGLGLSMSYDIIKAHGGELKVETKENDGTTFKIILPTSLSA